MIKERVEVYICRGYTLGSRTIFKGDPLPKGYSLDKQAVEKVCVDNFSIFKKENESLKPEAEKKFLAVQKEYRKFLETVGDKYGAEVCSSATASDDTGLEPFLEVEISIKGEEYRHTFYFNIEE